MADAGRVLLKAVWANLTKAKVFAVDTTARELGLEVPVLGLVGRAERRLAPTVAMARHLRDRATT